MTRSNKAPSQRQLQASEMLKIAMNESLKTGKILHAGFENSLITVTRANVSPDLRNAKIYITSFGGAVSDEEKKKILTKLNDAQTKNYIRKFITNKVNFKYSPDLIFKFDDEFDQLVRVNNLINKAMSN